MKPSILILSLGLLAGCAGAGYHSSKIVPGTTEDAKVRVMPMTAQSVLVANRSKYQPRQLPAAFTTTAGYGGGLRSAGTTPNPVFVAQRRPGKLTVNLPPRTKPQPYRVGVGDVVLLATPTGSSIEQLSGLLAAQNSRQGYTVQDDGSIAIADVGRIEIADLTLEDAEALLFQRLVKSQIEPTFSLEIAEFNSKKVSIGGAVARPGVLPITLAPLDLKQALATAGGPTAPTQDYTSVRLLREGKIYQIPLEELYNNSNLDSIPLLAGDSIFVDDTYEIDQAEAYFRQQIELSNFRQQRRSVALSNLTSEVALRREALNETRKNYLDQVSLDAVERDYVFLAGEVKKQGRMALPLGKQATLADAIYGGAEGISIKTADPRHVYVLRGSNDPMAFDALTAWQLDLRNAANLALATRFELRPNDVVFIAEQPVTRWGRTIDQISPTLISVGVDKINS